MSALGIRVLGPISVEIDGTAVPLPRARHREILAILVLARGRAVSADSLIGDLWDDGRPGTVGAVRTFVGELRRILEPERPARSAPTILVTEGRSYALRLASTAVD